MYNIFYAEFSSLGEKEILECLKALLVVDCYAGDFVLSLEIFRENIFKRSLCFSWWGEF